MGTKHWEHGQLLGKRRITPCHMKSGVNIVVTQKFEPTHAPCQDKERALHYILYASEKLQQTKAGFSVSSDLEKNQIQDYYRARTNTARRGVRKHVYLHPPICDVNSLIKTRMLGLSTTPERSFDAPHLLQAVFRKQYENMSLHALC